MSLRVVFMGTPDFAVPTLAEIIGGGHEVVACYTRAPAAAGRGRLSGVNRGDLMTLPDDRGESRNGEIRRPNEDDAEPHPSRLGLLALRGLGKLPDHPVPF